MATYSAASRTLQAARATYTLRGVGVQRKRQASRPLCLVYGNCQAEPLRALLAGAPDFRDRYESLRLPAVHELCRLHVAPLQRLLRAASVIITQPIKDGYRGLPLGTDQILALARSDCTVIRVPALHYDGLYPFQFNVLGKGLRGISAPITVYHDLRTLCGAGKGLNSDSATRWVTDYRPPRAAITAAAEEAASLIRDRETALDVRVSDSIIAQPGASGPSFFTVNHPSRFVLQRVAHEIREILGLSPSDETPDAHEPLGRYRTPLEPSVIEALQLAVAPTMDWIIKGRAVSTADVVRRHLIWYRRRPALVHASIAAHAERIAAFGLL